MAVLFVLLGIVWIVASDGVVRAVASSVEQVSTLQTLKGGMIVAVTAGVVYLLLRRELGMVEESEQRLELLTDHLDAGFFLVQDGRLVDLNRRLAEMLGYEPEELIGARPPDLVHPDDREQLAQFAGAVNSGETKGARLRIRVLRRDGDEVHADVVAGPVERADAKASIGLLLDSTDDVRFEDQVRRAQRMELLGQLTGAIAHDFNNFLTAILGPLEMCVRRAPPSHPLHEDLVLARDTAERAASLSRQLLTFSRKRPSRRRTVDLNEPVEDLRPLVRRITDDGVEVTFDLVDDPLPIFLDPAQLEQVLVNLVVNAAEAMPDGGRLDVRTYRVPPSPEILRHRDDADPGAHAVLEVSDSGAGIPEEVRLQIFEPFFTTKKKGTGLGLSTVFGIVDQADGFVRVESEPGEGSTFRVFVPLTDRPVRAEAAPDEPCAGDEPPEPPEPATVLVVEDEDPVRRVLSRMLDTLGYEAHVIPDAEAALERWEEIGDDVDVLITDLRLPGMGGRELAERLLEQKPGLAVVFASGYFERELLEELSEDRDGLFLEKPFTLEKLEEMVREALTAADGRESEER